MADATAISWCDSTFNPWMGCTKVSPACDDCYAARSTPARTMAIKWGAGQPRRRTSAATWEMPARWNAAPFYQCAHCGARGARDDFTTPCPEGRGGVHWLQNARRRVFCASLADVFDNEVDPTWRDELMGLIVASPNLDWLLLTKRIGNVSKMLKAEAWDHLPNVWLGATVVNQAEADRDIPKLLAVPARVRFLSIEPMLERIDLCEQFGIWWDQTLETWDTSGCSNGIHWVIAGGERGPKARPAHPDWFRSLCRQCAAAGVPFHFKQWGEWAPGHKEYGNELPFDLRTCSVGFEWYDGDVMACKVLRVGKKAAGRLLDGVEHNGFPGT